MRLLVGCATAAVAAVVLLEQVPASANPDQVASSTRAAVGDRAAPTPGCVTRHEFRRAHQDMRKGRVHRIFDTRGTLFGEADDRGFSRLYKQCHPAPGYDVCKAVVDYHIGRHGAARVEGKTWAVICFSDG
jgi:hypothetical protein